MSDQTRNVLKLIFWAGALAGLVWLNMTLTLEQVRPLAILIPVGWGLWVLVRWVAKRMAATRRGH